MKKLLIGLLLLFTLGCNHDLKMKIVENETNNLKALTSLSTIIQDQQKYINSLIKNNVELTNNQIMLSKAIINLQERVEELENKNEK